MAAIDRLLKATGSQLESWELTALCLGAAAAIRPGVAIHLLFDRIWASAPVLGKDLDEANANLRVLTDFWNELVERCIEDCSVELSEVPLDDPPTERQLRALAKRRRDEIAWFTRGLAAAGDDPTEYPSEVRQLLQTLEQMGTLFETIDRQLPQARGDVSELSNVGRQLARSTETIEALVVELSSRTSVIRRRALAAGTPPSRRGGLH